MNKIALPIDTKSLYYNILNDNLKGHTCTVATPIKQRNSINKELMEVYKIPREIDFEMYPELINELTKNSKSIVRINNVFCFDKLKVNNIPLKLDRSFCFYTKEEIDKKRAQFGRIKLHYPLTLKYEPLNIDNKKVINAISDLLNNYAFIIEGFEYCEDDNSLNFKTLIVGYPNIPYSKVFINNKGIGNKYSTLVKNYFDIYDTEIVPLKNKFGSEINPSNFGDYIEIARGKSKELVSSYICSKDNVENIRDISNEYPYSLFDFQYYENNVIHYAIVFGTYSKVKYFNLTSYQNQFVNIFDNVTIFIVTDINGNNHIHEINRYELENFSAQVNLVRFIKDR